MPLVGEPYDPKKIYGTRTGPSGVPLTPGEKVSDMDSADTDALLAAAGIAPGRYATYPDIMQQENVKPTLQVVNGQGIVD